MAAPSTPTNYTNCTYSIQAATFDNCPSNVHFGAQINQIYITTGSAFTDITDSSEWTTRLALAISDADAVVKMVGIGTYAEPDVGEVEISNNRTIPNTRVKSHLIEFEIDEINISDTHAFLRQLEYGGSFRVFPTTLSGHMLTYDDNGIEGTLICTSATIIDGDKDAPLKAKLRFNWTPGTNTAYQVSPALISNPAN